MRIALAVLLTSHALIHLVRNYRIRFAGRIRSAADASWMAFTGEQHSFTAAKTVTIFNDMCAMAPATLIDPDMTWSEIDDKTVEGTLQRGLSRTY